VAVVISADLLVSLIPELSYMEFILRGISSIYCMFSWKPLSLCFYVDVAGYLKRSGRCSDAFVFFIRTGK
jgi:hypothetical protein